MENTAWQCPECDTMYTLPLFSDEELAIIKWLAGLVKAQALSERNSANALYIAYNDRGFVHSDLQQARDKIAKCEAILAKLEAM
jgi:hypothetical protein